MYGQSPDVQPKSKRTQLLINCSDVLDPRKNGQRAGTRAASGTVIRELEKSEAPHGSRYPLDQPSTAAGVRICSQRLDRVLGTFMVDVNSRNCAGAYFWRHCVAHTRRKERAKIMKFIAAPLPKRCQPNCTSLFWVFFFKRALGDVRPEALLATRAINTHFTGPRIVRYFQPAAVSKCIYGSGDSRTSVPNDLSGSSVLGFVGSRRLSYRVSSVHGALGVEWAQI